MKRSTLRSARNVVETTEPGIHFRPLFRLELAVAARKGHPLARATSLSDWRTRRGSSSIRRGPAVLWSGPSVRPVCHRPMGLVHCESYVTALALIARSDLLGLVPPEIIEEPMAHRYIQRIHVRESILRPRIGIFTRADTPLSPTAALMVQALVSAARSRRP